MQTQSFTRTLVAVVGFVIAMLSPSALADGLIIVHDPPDVPHGHYPFAPLQVKHHHVDVSINDQVAVTEVNQTFFNPNGRQLEGTYIFPIPEGAQIDQFRMDINGEMVEAELLDASKARKLYEDIVRKMKDPALMEYAGQGLFKVRIFPIEPNSEKKVNLKYTEVLRRDSSMISYRYPLNTEKFSSAPVQSVSVKVDVQCTSPIKTVYCPSHDVEIARHGDSKATIGFERSNERPDRDFELLFSTEDSSSEGIGLDVLTYRPDTGEPGFFMLLASPSVSRVEQQILPKDVIFVLDTSGSMAGKKLEQAQGALKFCLHNLNSEDRFDVVRFSTEAEPLFGALTTRSDEAVDKAVTFIDDFKARGGTAIESALLSAIESSAGRERTDRPFMLVFLTDGRPTVGTTDPQQIVDTVTGKIGDRTLRVFCFGIGTDINTHLLDKIAQKTNATREYVLPDEDIEVKVSNFYTKVDSPVLANPKLTVEGGNITLSKLQPGELPDVFKGEQLVVFGRYTGAGDAALAITGNLAGTKRTIVEDAVFEPHETDNDFIARLWATRRVGWLLDQIRLNGESEELTEEVTRLARQYGIVTPYTAYLILEDDRMPVAFRSGAAPESMNEARREASRRYNTLQSQASGDLAVDASKAGQQMQQASGSGGGGFADAPAQMRLLGVAVQRGGGQQTAPVRYVNGRTFYFNGDTWVDSTIGDLDDDQQKPTTIELGSDAYFDLLAEHPEASRWLALGRRVQLQLDGTVYEITPEAAGAGERED